MLYAEGKSGCGLPPYPVLAALLLRSAFGHRENQLRVSGLEQRVTTVEPAGRCLVRAYDLIRVTEGAGCQVSSFLGVHSCGWAEEHVLPVCFPGGQSVDCAFWPSLWKKARGAWTGSVLTFSLGGCVTWGIVDPTPLPWESLSNCKTRTGLRLPGASRPQVLRAPRSPVRCRRHTRAGSRGRECLSAQGGPLWSG